jgi:nicotinamide-nucleotide amidase
LKRDSSVVSSPPTAAVVAVGDELLFGTTVNTNGAWLSEKLSDLGLHVVRQEMVGDRKDQIAEVVGKALEGVEVVVVTGGLGPTPDDLTREAVAELLGVRWRLDEDLLAGLRRRFRSLGFETLPESSERMAMIPESGRPLANPLGAAPGLAIEAQGGRLCVLLPGIPREMRAIFHGDLSSFLLDRFSRRLRPVIHRTIHTTGVPESVLAAQVAELLPAELLPAELAPVTVAFLPDLRGVRLRLSTRMGNGDAGEEAILDRVENSLELALSGCRYHAGTGDLAEALGHALLKAEASVAVAESCTGGLIAKRITDHPGASRYFRGGVVAYANEVKTGVLRVPHEILQRHGAVSREMAESMARGVAARLGAAFGVGVTGIAGPGGGTAERPIGTVWYAVGSAQGLVARKEIFLGGREAIRERAAQAAMNLLLRVLETQTS